MRNWINLITESANAELVEAKMFSSRPFRGAEYEKFYKNPTLSDLTAMLPTRDLRGITDGKNVFVWDASKLIHAQGAAAVAEAGLWEGPVLDPLYDGDRLTPKFNAYRDALYFFAGSEEDRHTGSEWVGNRSFRIAHGVEMFRLADGVSMSCYKQATPYLESLPTVARMMRKATSYDETPEPRA